MRCLFYIFYCGCVFLCCLPTTIVAQKQASVWYFGQYAGLDFNSGSPVALTNGALATGSGCSSIADEDGKILFYTDGIEVWNRNHQKMLEANEHLHGGGDLSTHSGFIAPKPGSTTKYYIFTVDIPPPFGQYGLQHSVVDMNAGNGLGKVIIQNIPLVDSVCTKIAITRHGDGRGFWVVTKKMDSNAYYAFLVVDTGIVAEPVISYCGLNPRSSSLSSTGGQIKFSPDGTKLATAFPNPIDRFEIVEFDKFTGRLYNAVESSTLNSVFGAYGIEFSPDSKKLYVARMRKGYLLQYDLSVYTADAIFASEYIIKQDVFFDGLQLAPNGKIYVGHGENEHYISSINNPNDAGKNCQYSHHSVYLGGRTTKETFPSFLTSYFRKPDIVHHRTCVGDTTFFTLLQDAAIDSVRWDFDDPATGTKNVAFTKEASHVFSTPGTYRVRLRAYSGWVSDVVEHTVVVAPMPVVDLGPDREICLGTGAWLYAGEGGVRYKWSTGDTTSAVTVRESGVYWVAKRNGICEERDTLVLTFVMPEIFLNQDTLVCEGNSVQLHAPAAASYLWEPSDGLSAVDVADPIASPSSTTTYTVRVQEEDGCLKQGRVTIRVLPKSLLTVRAADTLVVSSMSEFALPLLVQTPPSWLPLQVRSIEADIRFFSDAFEFTGATQGVTTKSTTGGETTVHIELTDVELRQEQQEITSLVGMVLLGENLTSPFVVENVRISGCGQERSGVSHLSLDSSGMCALNMRRIRTLVKPEIVVNPHPVTAESGIGIRTTEGGIHRIVVHTATGTPVMEELFDGLRDHTYEVAFPTSVSSGMYTLTLYTPSGAIRRSFVVSR